MKNMIILEKIKDKERLLENIANTTTLAKMASSSNHNYLVGRYI